MGEDGTEVIATALLMAVRRLSTSRESPSPILTDCYNNLLDEAKRGRPHIPESLWPPAVDGASLAVGQSDPEAPSAEPITYRQLEVRVLRLLAHLRKIDPGA